MGEALEALVRALRRPARADHRGRRAAALRERLRRRRGHPLRAGPRHARRRRRRDHDPAGGGGRLTAGHVGPPRRRRQSHRSTVGPAPEEALARTCGVEHLVAEPLRLACPSRGPRRCRPAPRSACQCAYMPVQLAAACRISRGRPSARRGSSSRPAERTACDLDVLSPSSKRSPFTSITRGHHSGCRLGSPTSSQTDLHRRFDHGLPAGRRTCRTVASRTPTASRGGGRSRPCRPASRPSRP